MHKIVYVGRSQASVLAFDNTIWPTTIVGIVAWDILGAMGMPRMAREAAYYADSSLVSTLKGLRSYAHAKISSTGTSQTGPIANFKIAIYRENITVTLVT